MKWPPLIATTVERTRASATFDSSAPVTRLAHIGTDASGVAVSDLQVVIAGTGIQRRVARYGRKSFIGLGVEFAVTKFAPVVGTCLEREEIELPVNRSPRLHPCQRVTPHLLHRRQAAVEKGNGHASRLASELPTHARL
jgi:hypothetical protein